MDIDIRKKYARKVTFIDDSGSKRTNFAYIMRGLIAMVRSMATKREDGSLSAAQWVRLYDLVLLKTRGQST